LALSPSPCANFQRWQAQPALRNSNTISIDDAVFKGSFTAQTFGPNNVINVEKNTALTGLTDFKAAVTMAMYGASGQINLGNANDTINRIRFGGSVLFIGGNPQTIVRYTASGTTFNQQPTLINASLQNIDVI